MSTYKLFTNTNTSLQVSSTALNFTSNASTGAELTADNTGVYVGTGNGVEVITAVLRNHANLNFANDAGAAAGGVPLGGLYHNAGAVLVRRV